MRTVMRRSFILPTTVLLWALACGATVGYGLGNPVRSAVVLPFLCFGPGLALVPLLRIAGWAGLTVAVGVSLALDELVPTAMIYARAWSPDATLAILVVLSVLGAAAQVAVDLHGSRRALEAAP